MAARGDGEAVGVEEAGEAVRAVRRAVRTDEAGDGADAAVRCESADGVVRSVRDVERAARGEGEFSGLATQGMTPPLEV